MRLESILLCPACGSTGPVVFESCRDALFDICGVWNYRQCRQCGSLWIDARPSEEDIASLYPTHYCTHHKATTPLEAEGIAPSAKLSILEHFYGYTGLSQRASSRIGRSLGRRLGYLTRFSSRAGYTVRFLPLRAQGNLLDVGSGNGAYLKLMSELGWKTVGIEPDTHAAEIALTMGLRVMQCRIEEAELKPDSYDAVTLHHVLEHLPDPKRALGKLVGCLKPGGVLVSFSPNPTGMLARFFRQTWYELDPPRHLVLPSPDGYRRMLEGAGCRVKVSTTMQLAFWVSRESLSIKRSGRAGNYRGWLLPKIISLIGSNCILPVLPYTGEEVVCIATKN